MSLAIAVLVSAAPAGATAPAAPGEESGRVVAVEHVDLDRYAGLWYEIARLPNRYQERCAGEVMAEYRLREDGRIGVVNTCRDASGDVVRVEGVARRSESGGEAGKLEVRFAPAILSFLPFVWGDYWILELADDYSHALVGGPSREYLWILARSPDLPDSLYRSLLERAAAQGFDVERVQKTRHTRPDPGRTDRGRTRRNGGDHFLAKPAPVRVEKECRARGGQVCRYRLRWS
jgi:apolipoprotein D and lipocalin family protein